MFGDQNAPKRSGQAGRTATTNFYELPGNLFHPATVAYVKRRTEEGKTNREIIRCLKRYLAREIYHYLMDGQTPVAAVS